MRMIRASLGDVGKRAPADVHDAHKPRGYERAAADAHGLWIDVRQLMRVMLASLRIDVKPAAADAHDAREPSDCGDTCGGCGYGVAADGMMRAERVAADAHDAREAWA